MEAYQTLTTQYPSDSDLLLSIQKHSSDDGPLRDSHKLKFSIDSHVVHNNPASGLLYEPVSHLTQSSRSSVGSSPGKHTSQIF
jgi:hypothetical protein